ncbi:MAG: hypothetical protein MUF49_04550 [Oculatellaceae cyanobacterium Prado106]|nr:hypothetical protein [Oculatellaceae cyanobacterium Prado106]
MNTGLTVDRGSTATITTSNLAATDLEEGGDRLVFTLNSPPSQGNLFLNGSTLQGGSTFTQEDINNNRITFQTFPGTQLPSASSNPFEPKISNSNVVWNAFDGQDYELFFFNAATGNTTRLTDNSVDDLSPQISGSNIVWQSGTGSSADIFFYNGSSGTTRRFTEDSIEDINPQISGSNVTWQKKFDTHSDIFFYNSSSDSFDVIDNGAGFDDVTPGISGNEIAFRREEFNGTANDGVFVFNIDNRSTRRVGAGEVASSDSFNFNVSDGSASTFGTFNLTIS